MESGHYVINISQSSCFRKCVPCLNKALQYQSILLSKCFYVSMLLAGVMSVWYILCVVFSREIQEPPWHIITSYCMIYDTWWGSTDWYWNMDTSATTKHQKKPFCVNLPSDLFFFSKLCGTATALPSCCWLRLKNRHLPVSTYCLFNVYCKQTDVHQVF